MGTGVGIVPALMVQGTPLATIMTIVDLLRALAANQDNVTRKVVNGQITKSPAVRSKAASLRLMFIKKMRRTLVDGGGILPALMVKVTPLATIMTGVDLLRALAANQDHVLRLLVNGQITKSPAVRSRIRICYW